MMGYEISDEGWISITDGVYAGAVYKYGRVAFEEVGEELKMSYEVIFNEGSSAPDGEFGVYVGPILVELIEANLVTNSIVYAGGVDED